MAGRWTTVARGIRCRDHETRKHGVKPDRYYVLRYSHNGRQVEEALGWASEGWNLELAQEELSNLRRAKRTGEGPASLREKREAEHKAKAQRKDEDARRTRLEKTVADLWDRYVKEVVAVGNKPRTAAEKTRMWEKRIKPALGALKIKDVTEEDAGAVVRSPLKVDETGQVIGGKAQAGNLYRLTHHLFQKALAWNLRPKELGNPLENVTEPKVARRERLLTGNELGALIKALDKAAAEKTEKPQIVAVIKVAILTGARISELLTLRWDAIRREDMEFHLADTKTGFSRRPLSADALALLDSVEKMPGVPFVFRALDNSEKPLSYNTVEKAFRRIVAAAGVERCTLHTVRHWFATMTANSVSNPRVGMALTGHKSHQAYMTYIHGDKEQARALADQLATLANELGQAKPNVAAMPSQTAKRS
jgi:integrase